MNGERPPYWMHGMTPAEWLAYRPPSLDEALGRALISLDGPFDDSRSDPGTGEPTPRRGVLARLRAYIRRWV
jgi:hypothetical protein